MPIKKESPPRGNGAASPISHKQENDLWEKNILGEDTPKQLSNALFFYSGKFFGLRGGAEHRDLEWGKQIKLSQGEEGEVLIYKSYANKNFNGGLEQVQSGVKPKEVVVFPNKENPNRCFIKIYKKYANLRPTNGKATAYYLKPRIGTLGNKWFDDMAIGHNTLSNLFKTICSSAGLTG